jgi:hypothetical protein
MPFAFEDIALRSQVADDSADFMGGKSAIDGDREVRQPLNARSALPAVPSLKEKQQHGIGTPPRPSGEDDS